MTTTPAPGSPNKVCENYSSGEQKSQRPEGISHRSINCVAMHQISMRALSEFRYKFGRRRERRQSGLPLALFLCATGRLAPLTNVNGTGRISSVNVRSFEMIVDAKSVEDPKGRLSQEFFYLPHVRHLVPGTHPGIEADQPVFPAWDRFLARFQSQPKWPGVARSRQTTAAASPPI